MGRIRVLVVDDHELIRSAVRLLLADEDEIEQVGEVRSGDEVLSAVARLRPDLVLLDIQLPGRDGLSCLQLIRDRHPDVKVVMFSALDEQRIIEQTLALGAHGFVSKAVNPRDLTSTIRQVCEQTVFVAPAVPFRADPATQAGLTKREAEVLRGLAQGLSNKQIGRDLHVTEQTIKFHLTSLFRKLGASNRTDAARIAHARGLVANPLLDQDPDQHAHDHPLR